MTTTPAAVQDVIEAPASLRLSSIDIFRGLTMMVMIFVNDLDSVHGLPWWTHHADADIDVMTYVDMVFPFFLFAIGLSIPIAVRQRLKRNPSVRALWLHVLIRAASLVVLGLILANAENGSRSYMGISSDAWAILALSGAALYLSVYTGRGSNAKLHRWIQTFGLALTAVMIALFRRQTEGGHVAWMDASYLEILGLLGCAYFVVALLYISTRRWLVAPLVWFVALLGFSALCAAGWITFPYHLPLYIWPVGDGTMSCVAMAGVVTSTIFLGTHRWQSPRGKITLALAFGVAVLIAGWFLTPLGISKIRDTPTWGLYSAGAAVLVFTALYWIADVKQQTRWASLVRPAGANTLLTYLLPDFYYFIAGLIGFEYFGSHFNYGWLGVLRSAVFTVIILALAGLFTRLKIRLQL